ncbi:hypothetical protein HYH03_010756 [Edaphochlamys debaryana]|uniref:Dynein axonemal assembly factor 11-like CS domain-containing protein n=1 Tax=Edaphochlamys debaryana TaxID=47281 RepID=A0A835XWE2_9CHLO|nr:hypothetical protein HYH03_010756 [Edaphochlamys debaryana]|eukprot:KAG2490837.1 hypothetical protein HYH03_010756 [Edaphochlamys debaryana]
MGSGLWGGGPRGKQRPRHSTANDQPSTANYQGKGKLLQLLLPAKVRPDASKAQRNTSTSMLVLNLPKEDPAAPVVDVAKLAAAQGGEGGQEGGSGE